MKDLQQIIAKKLSKDIVEYLQTTYGDNYSQIAKKIKISRTHVSRVAGGKKGFCLGTLMKIEGGYKEPLPLILLKSVKDDDIPEELKESYKNLKKTIFS